MRSLIIKSLEALLLLVLPLAWISRLIFIPGRRYVSIWTGAPIICMAKNCRAERLLGIESKTVVRGAYYITDEFDYDLSQLAGKSKVLSLLLSYCFFIWICVVARQVHAYVDGGILPARQRNVFNPVELFVYRLLGIRLFVWTYGADVRTRNATLALGVPNCCTDCSQVGVACICSTDVARKNYERVSRCATAVFSMGDMIEYTEGSRNDLFFWPIDLEMEGGQRYRPEYPTMEDQRPLRVVHAPNHREFKGTRYLERAINALREEGGAIELILVERLPNNKALEIYRSADVIFDQCLIGFHGYFALEAMALGKPVMCFIRKPDQYLLHADECPIVNTHVDTLEDDLRWLVDHRSELGEIGRRGRQYIEKYYSLEAFAERLRGAYRDLGIMQ